VIPRNDLTLQAGNTEGSPVVDQRPLIYKDVSNSGRDPWLTLGLGRLRVATMKFRVCAGWALVVSTVFLIFTMAEADL
jgi:hypothetical protein